VTPSRDDNVTTSTPTATACPVCGRGFIPVRRQRYCSPACRQGAYRRRQPPAPTTAVAVPPGRSRRAGTVYACTECEARYLGQQWCPDCNRPCTRIGGRRPMPALRGTGRR